MKWIWSWSGLGSAVHERQMEGDVSKSGDHLLEDSRAAAVFFRADAYRVVETKRLLPDLQSEVDLIRPEISPAKGGSIRAAQLKGMRQSPIPNWDHRRSRIRSFGPAAPAHTAIHAAGGDFCNADGTPPHLDGQ